MITSLSRKKGKGKEKGEKGKGKEGKRKIFANFRVCRASHGKWGGGKKWFSKLIYTPVFDLGGVYYQMVTPPRVCVKRSINSLRLWLKERL